MRGAKKKKKHHTTPPTPNQCNQAINPTLIFKIESSIVEYLWGMTLPAINGREKKLAAPSTIQFNQIANSEMQNDDIYYISSVRQFVVDSRRGGFARMKNSFPWMYHFFLKLASHRVNRSTHAKTVWTSIKHDDNSLELPHKRDSIDGRTEREKKLLYIKFPGYSRDICCWSLLVGVDASPRWHWIIICVWVSEFGFAH